MQRSLIALSLALLWIMPSIAADNSQKEKIYLMLPNVPVTSIENSTKFYTEIFGLKVGFVSPSGATIKDAKEVVLNTEDGPYDFKSHPGLVLIHTNDKPMPAERAVLKRFSVITTNIAAVEARAKAAGVEAVVPQSGYALVRFFTDPDGYVIEVNQQP